MTITQMHTVLDLELDKSSALDLPVYLDSEKDRWLNLAIRKFVKTRYSGLNVKRQSFEQTQKRTDDLRTLVVSSDITLGEAGASKINGYIGNLPSDAGTEYWLMVGERCTINATDVVSYFETDVTPCTQDEYVRALNNPFSEHILHYQIARPLRLFHSNSVELISDGTYSVGEYHLTYIKKPVEVDSTTGSTIDCDLPEHTHDEIVKIAVDMMLENIESPRQQTYTGQVATME